MLQYVRSGSKIDLEQTQVQLDPWGVDHGAFSLHHIPLTIGLIPTRKDKSDNYLSNRRAAGVTFQALWLLQPVWKSHAGVDQDVAGSASIVASGNVCMGRVNAGRRDIQSFPAVWMQWLVGFLQVCDCLIMGLFCFIIRAVDLLIVIWMRGNHKQV